MWRQDRCCLNAFHHHKLLWISHSLARDNKIWRKRQRATRSRDWYFELWYGKIRSGSLYVTVRSISVAFFFPEMGWMMNILDKYMWGKFLIMIIIRIMGQYSGVSLTLLSGLAMFEGVCWVMVPNRIPTSLPLAKKIPKMEHESMFVLLILTAVHAWRQNRSINFSPRRSVA